MGLIISRDSGYADRLRAYAIIVDGKKIGEIRNGETKEFPVEAGTHRISAKIDWCGTAELEFVVKEGESRSFNVSSNLRGIKVLCAGWYALFATDKYLRMEPTATSPAHAGRQALD